MFDQNKGAGEITFYQAKQVCSLCFVNTRWRT